MEKEKFINVRLSKYVEFWKQGIEQNVIYAMKMILYVNVGRIFDHICQNLSLLKLPFF
jgi:hypothetical protein